MSQPRKTTILHVTEHHTAATGGISYAVDSLTRHLPLADFKSIVLASGHDPLPAAPGGEVWSTDCEDTFLGRLWHYAPRKTAAMFDEICRKFSPDLVHVHGVWMGPQLIAMRSAAKLGIPTIVSPHGTMFFERWKNGGYFNAQKKKIYLKWILQSFRNVTALHAITGQEQEYLKTVAAGIPIRKIPNFVDGAGLTAQSGSAGPDQRVKRILYLGRISIEKGIERLIRGFVEANLPDDFYLEICGPVWNRSYFEGLQKLALSLNLGDRCKFTGPVFGAEKNRLFSTSWIVVVPSYTEVVGLVNLEASYFQTPTITTWETGLDMWNDSGGVVLRDFDVAFPGILRDVCAWSDEERQRRGEQAQRYVVEHFGARNVIRNWTAFYTDIANAGRGKVHE